MDIVVGLVHGNGLVVYMERTDGTVTFPSGKVKEGEAFPDAVKREILEETGLLVEVQRDLGSRERDENTLHYFLCRYISGELMMKEPDKFRRVTWMAPQRVIPLAGPHLFPPIKEILKQPGVGLRPKIS